MDKTPTIRYPVAVNRRVAGKVVLIAAVTVWVFAAAPNPEVQAQIAKAQSLQASPPDWAFAINPPADAAASKVPDATPRHVPESDAAFSEAQTRDFFSPPDWHPVDHSAMPDIVSHGRPPQVFACGYCHLPNGQGRPENSSLAGLPVAYIVQQLADFKDGKRQSSEPRHAPTTAMITNETKANGSEIRAAAEYFSALKPRPWIRVVETDTVPKTHVAGWMLVALEGGEMEPIGQRIVESPENLERTELRDDHSGFVAYVPVGSIKKGEMLAAGGANRALRCAACHGRDLKGSNNVPRLAGRSPSYMVRQLYDMQHGSRAGGATNRMKPVVADLSIEDMVAIAAYVASLNP